MSNWSEGYVADIPYALGFYRETVPTHLAFAATAIGRDPGAAVAPKRVLELGFGMGLGFVINAAANPHCHFEGVDFAPTHVAHAAALIEDAKLTNVSVREASFQDLAREAPEGQHDLDVIVLHGILTWVSTDAHEAIVEIARKRLKPGGLLYVSYNCMPGWSALLPLQRLMRENAKRHPGRSDAQTRSGLELVSALMAEGAGYFVANPMLQQRVEHLNKHDPNYLAHEYLNANWHIFHVADVAAMFARAKLDFLGSATVLENLDSLSAPQAVQGRIAAEQDPIFKETLRDIAANRQFRRDIYVRGGRALKPQEMAALLAPMQFAAAQPRDAMTFTFKAPVGELTGDATIYNAIADLLATRPATFAEIAALPVFPAGNSNPALQAVSLLVHSGQILPGFVGEAAAKPDNRPAQRLNRALVDHALKGRSYAFLAAPAVGSGIQVGSPDMLMLSGHYAGAAKTGEQLAAHVGQVLARLGLNWQAEGKVLSEPAERDAAIRRAADSFVADKLPVWRKLGIV